MVSRQGGSCAICREKPKPDAGGRTLVVEHSHRSNLVRGAACLACNSILGYARDSREILQAAIDYLDRAELEEDLFKDFPGDLIGYRREQAAKSAEQAARQEAASKTTPSTETSN
jgi:hypothetical protein